MTKKDKQKASEYDHLTQHDYEEELDLREFSMFWNQLDLSRSWVPVLKVFLIRFAYVLSQIHMQKHPDEVQQSKEITYRILYGQTPDFMGGVQSHQTWEWWPGFSIRTYLYPLWLSLPGFALKAVSLDSNFNIVNSIYFMHTLMWVVGDYYQFMFVR